MEENFGNNIEMRLRMIDELNKRKGLLRIIQKLNYVLAVLFIIELINITKIPTCVQIPKTLLTTQQNAPIIANKSVLRNSTCCKQAPPFRQIRNNLKKGENILQNTILNKRQQFKTCYNAEFFRYLVLACMVFEFLNVTTKI